ncbi:unnamed protein product [Paramecium octaurelia]|uniref:MORN repeat protein n=1 Tax=Paramecium octaurelia TaxID=43137 RepID=A0A8S1UQW2_PAROT|nr:unnamed protein product [Paramecium octaurelia]
MILVQLSFYKTTSNQISFINDNIIKYIAIIPQLIGIILQDSQSNKLKRSFQSLIKSMLFNFLLNFTHIQDVKIKLYKNAAFYGTLVDGLRQGQGILIKSTLQLYEGSFVRDKKDGIGFELLKQIQFYYGTYLNGLPHGEGVFWSKNQKYIGQWHQGKKLGIGWYQGTHSDYYLGQWENGRCFGLCIYINGDIYEGYFTNDLKHGNGQEYFENGDYFVGEYRNGKPNGPGEFHWNKNLSMVKEMVMECGRVKHKKVQIYIKVNMLMIKKVDKEYLNMLMELNMKGILQMTRDVDMVRLHGKTRLLTRVIGWMDQQREKEYMNMTHQY